MKIIIEDTVYFYKEDMGKALIAELSEDSSDPDSVFVRLHSWDETKKHDQIMGLQGKKVRITIEEIENENQIQSRL